MYRLYFPDSKEYLSTFTYLEPYAPDTKIRGFAMCKQYNHYFADMDSDIKTDFTQMDKCELVIAGSGEHVLPPGA